MSRRQRGSAAVEFTLAAPLLISLFLGTWQFGYAFYLYNELEHTVRTGARYASARVYDSATETPTAAYTNAVANVVVYGNPNPASGSEPLVPGLTTAHVKVTVTFAKKVPAKVRVAIDGYSVGTLGALTLQNKPLTEFPFLGIYAPPPAS